MNKIFYLEKSRLFSFLENIRKEYRVFSPAIKEEELGKEKDYFYTDFVPGCNFIFNPYRMVEPAKAFLTYPLERVAGYFGKDRDVIETEKTVILGAKNCDITALKIQDFVFLEGVEMDSLYRAKRENTIFISGDCTAFKDTCFCGALNITPYPESDFDLNLSPLNGGYILEVASGKGLELIKQFGASLKEAEDSQIALRKKNRDDLVEKLKKYLLPQNIPITSSLQRLVREGYNLDTWKKFMLTCVECGGCNLVCNTCHCFLLADTKENGINSKTKLWDSCQYTNFSRVAGGANPLKTRAQRFRNRFLKKFDFFLDNLKMSACCGCGRCIEVCPGKIDIREVLKDLASKLNVTK
ncbi:MAG: 4Fe-4S dicluster domain-containing protein [Candidatus Omnitrophica bacterium]|nr:4Fe-4S dicluster domain-containing protein [Candidatus Omnitrophota bacterium]